MNRTKTFSAVAVLAGAYDNEMITGHCTGHCTGHSFWVSLLWKWTEHPDLSYETGTRPNN